MRIKIQKKNKHGNIKPEFMFCVLVNIGKIITSISAPESKEEEEEVTEISSREDSDS